MGNAVFGEQLREILGIAVKLGVGQGFVLRLSFAAR